MSTNTALNALNEHLRGLIGKKVQVFYIGPDDVETSAAGRLLQVTSEIIKIDGSLATTTLFRKHIRITVVDHVTETETLDTVKLIIRRTGEAKLDAKVLGKIGKLIESGQRAADNNPEGFTWSIISQWAIEEKTSK